MRLGGADEFQRQVSPPTVVGVDQRAVHLGAFLDGGRGNPCSHARPVGLLGQLLADLRQSILAVGLVDMRQPLRSCAHERDAAPQKGTGRTHLRGRDVVGARARSLQGLGGFSLLVAGYHAMIRDERAPVPRFL
jgi:hypothetical protein